MADPSNSRTTGADTLTGGADSDTFRWLIRDDDATDTVTDFTGGAKTIALIAAAEWFQEMDSASASGAGFASTRGELAAFADRSKPVILAERGREGLFLFDPSDQSANVGRDSAQGVHVAAAEDSTGASGAWVRKYSGPVEAIWFGAAGDGIADDTAALQAALTFVEGIGDCVLRIRFVIVQNECRATVGSRCKDRQRTSSS